MGTELEVGAAIVASVNGDRERLRRKRDRMPRVVTLPGSYVGSGTTFGYLSFPQTTPGKIWEVLRIGACSGDPFDVLTGTMIAFRSATIPQDSNNEPGPLGDLIAVGGQIPNTSYPGRYACLTRANERVVLAFEGIAAGAQITASIDVIEHDFEAFLMGLDEVD